MYTITEIQEYLQNLTNLNKITYTEIGKGLGTGRSNVSLRAKNGSELNISEVKRLEKYFNVEILNKLNNNTDNEHFADIPIKGEVYASMGSGITVYNETQTGTYKISRELARDIGVNLNNTEMIFAKGDSMEPTIIGGDSLLIDLSKREVYDGSIYCVRIDGQLYAKRLQKIPPHTVAVISDNPKYKTFEIDFSKEIDFDFEIIGEIRWWGRVSR